MARYVCRVRAPRPPDDVFSYLSDFRTVAEWDPGVSSSVQVGGDGPGQGARYEVEATVGGRGLTFRYSTILIRVPHRFIIGGRRFPFLSIDMVDVEPDGAGSIVVYDARLQLPFPLSLADPLVTSRFRGIGDAAAAGLAAALDGEWIR